jgi:hypothetical protein
MVGFLLGWVHVRMHRRKEGVHFATGSSNIFEEVSYSQGLEFETIFAKVGDADKLYEYSLFTPKEEH